FTGSFDDYSTVFIFWQLMFVDNGIAAGMGLTWKMGHWLKMGLACHVSVVPSKVVVDKDDEMLVLVFDGALGVGDGVSEIKFSGVLSEHMKGFYIKGVIFTSKML
ncbi:aminopeptidase M1-like protein isoform X1, partial [Tanacetum coccineum]